MPVAAPVAPVAPIATTATVNTIPSMQNKTRTGGINSAGSGIKKPPVPTNELNTALKTSAAPTTATASAPEKVTTKPNSNVGKDSAPLKRTRKVLRKKQKQGKPINKYVWIIGHCLTLGFGFGYILLYGLRFFLRWFWIREFSYRFSFIGVLLSYTVSLLTTFGRNPPGYIAMLATENFQNLTLALVWLISRASAFKLFPYYIISLLQISSFYKINPVLEFQNQLGDFIAFSELVVFVALFFDTLLFRGTSGFALVIYSAFYWLRLNFSPYTQGYILTCVQFIDDRIILNLPLNVQKKWKLVKEFVEFRRNQTRDVLINSTGSVPSNTTAASITSSGVNTGSPSVTSSIPMGHSDYGKSQGTTKSYQVSKKENELVKKPMQNSDVVDTSVKKTNGSAQMALDSASTTVDSALPRAKLLGK